MSNDEEIMNLILSDQELEELTRDNPRLRSSAEAYCPTCAKRGTYQWEGNQVKCNCEVQLQLHKHYLNAGIGNTYQRLDWEDYKGDHDVVMRIAKYVDNHEAYIRQGVGLILTGPFGSGKTMLGNLALKDFVKLRYRCYATTFAQTVDMYTAGWRSQEEKRRFNDRFVKSDVLLLDDVGRETRNKSKLNETTFDSILRTRVQHGKPTFLTSNLSMEELEEGYGSAVLSLLMENSTLIKVEGEDYRPKARERKTREVEAGEVRPIV